MASKALKLVKFVPNQDLDGVQQVVQRMEKKVKREVQLRNSIAKKEGVKPPKVLRDSTLLDD